LAGFSLFSRDGSYLINLQANLSRNSTGALPDTQPIWWPYVRGKGVPSELWDTMIAGMVLASHAVLATRNVTHLKDISSPVVNPWIA
jgi:hypothetical protein